MRTKLNSEYVFTREVENLPSLSLTVYINYENKTYDIVQPNQEGILFRHNNNDTKINTNYMILALEALDFIQSELYHGEEFTCYEINRANMPANGCKVQCKECAIKEHQ